MFFEFIFSTISSSDQIRLTCLQEWSATFSSRKGVTLVMSAAGAQLALAGEAKFLAVTDACTLLLSSSRGELGKESTDSADLTVVARFGWGWRLRKNTP
jgi:hypothetical protein